MIISHKLRVIHIRLKKVAGSSFEMALSRYCGADDILTPIKGSKESSYHRARNYEAFKIRKYIGHLSANEIKAIISPNIFDSYFKIATIRNPYQKAISWYFWKKRTEKLTKVNEDFEEFVSSECLYHQDNPLMDYDLIHIEGKSAVDFVIRYEHLAADIKNLETKIACPGLLETFSNINAKKNIRPNQGTSIYEVYSKYPKAKLMIDKMYYDNSDKYELLRKYWPIYKSEVENILADGTSLREDQN